MPLDADQQPVPEKDEEQRSPEAVVTEPPINENVDAVANHGPPQDHDPPPGAIYPRPSALALKEDFVWDENKSVVELYTALGRALATPGDLYRAPAYAGGLILGSLAPGIQPLPVTEPKQLAAVVLDRLRVKHVKDGKTKGRLIPPGHLNILLRSELFLQQFRPLDAICRSPRYFEDFSLPEAGYNDRGAGQRLLYSGSDIEMATTLEAIPKFLDVMAFATNADRTNAVAAALTAQPLRHFWPGAKPLLAVSSTKSHGGKDSTILFAAGATPRVSISYQATDWALERSFVGAMRHSPDTGVIVIENARLARKQPYIASSFIERLLTDPEPFLWSTGTGAPVRRRNEFVIAISTNFGTLSEDLVNRSLPIRLTPVGDVHDRTTPIGNPKLEFLPANRDRIEAELRGMVERWKRAGRPPDLSVKHPFTQWAQVVGGILRVNGFTNFLDNYTTSKTTQDPLRQALGLLGAATPGSCLTATEWTTHVKNLGLARSIVPENDRENDKSQARAIGVILSNHQGETFIGETDNDRFVLRLEKSRRRIGGKPATRYCFICIDRTELPTDPDEKEQQTQTPAQPDETGIAVRTPQGEAN
ncbi:MAG: hypothetical protein HYX68_27025 [Planctomycetes bacterium]|nr:hypothetical protein [Planctomycetota bacterium]